MALPLDITRLRQGFGAVARTLDARFLDKQESIRLMLIAAVAGEHMVMIGPPGTAKSALISNFATLVDASYFEYLLTRFTEPNEIFGPVDVAAFRAGQYARRVERMLPAAELVFLDEIFKSNSAILNSLLHVINERRFQNGPEVIQTPLISLFAASNEVPTDENLVALFDRFLLRVRADNLDSYHFTALMQKGAALEIAKLHQSTTRQRAAAPTGLLTANDLRTIHAGFEQFMHFDDEFLGTYKSLVFQIRSEGISLSDRRAVKMLKLFAASAIVDGRAQANAADFFVLRHIWNSPEQADLLDDIVGPVVEAYYQRHPTVARIIGPTANLDQLLSELALIRDLLTSNQTLTDIQMFSQLKNLSEIKVALAALPEKPPHVWYERLTNCWKPFSRHQNLAALALNQDYAMTDTVPPASTRPLRVAIFDDVVAARGETFHIPGVHVTVYQHADDAETHCQDAAFDLVFMDFSLGTDRRTGKAAVEALRASGFAGKIIAISSDPAANQAMLAAGANEALDKKAHLRSYLLHVGTKHLNRG